MRGRGSRATGRCTQEPRHGGPPCAPGLLLLALLLTAASARAQAEEEEPPPRPADAPTIESDREQSREVHPWLALGEVTAINLAVWLYDRTIGQKEWARVTLDDWGNNLRTGFVWDADDFSANQFAHPYHGGLYYTAARDNGLPFVACLPYTLLGSAQWELFAENEPPSINDLINTSIGGMAMGEALYRLSSMVLDTEATGRERFGREFLAGAISPVRGINRLLRGDSFRKEPTPAEWWPLDFAGWGTLGYLNLGDGKLLRETKNQFFAQLSLRYGDAFTGDIRRPFDAFEGHVQFTTRENSLVSHARLAGVLVTQSLKRSEEDSLRLALVQQLSYVDTLAYEVGGQSLSAVLMQQHRLSRSTLLKSSLGLEGHILTGISSEHSGEGRNYDYGPGVGLEGRVIYGRDSWDIVTLEAGIARVVILDGAGGTHQILTGRALLDFPVVDRLGLGTELNLFQRHSRFDYFPDVRKETYELRVFFSIH
ncbi:DUF3943 domain-containing protein [Myxococcus sp. K15C18031901]|uniref:DUF3943 domain-containing protein n=1 Tax=Myxococcus dinghuensis TaxID=2906761 RepID=UPI0020A7C1BE|nr:DUF3943 domain-containing protein [Myxococcus dinghuensis]MCP3102242.1 DUF3943 domain-containing protein [Myxococcus dinghuensis]